MLPQKNEQPQESRSSALAGKIVSFFRKPGLYPIFFMGIAAAAVTLGIWLHTAINLTVVELNVYDREKYRVFTRAENVKGLLEEQGIEKGAGDRVLPSPYRVLEDGMKVELREPFPWEKTAYKEGFRYTSYAAGLAETLKARAIGNQKGEASWYGSLFHGRRTTSGEIFDKHALTAAHRELPLGTWVKVTFLRNDESVMVRINDRGPFIGDRIIDLSSRAAEEIGLRPYGIGRVRVEVVGIERGYPLMLEYIAALAEEEMEY